MLALRPQVRPGFLELCIARRPCGVGTPSLGMTYDLLSRPLHWRPSSPVNEVEDPGGMAGTVWRLSKCCWLCGGGLSPPMQEVGRHCVPLVLIRLCSTIGIVCGLPVVSRNFLESGPPWGCFRPSIEYIKCTLPALTATPLQRTWLNESGWLPYLRMSFMWFTRSFVQCCILTAWLHKCDVGMSPSIIFLVLFATAIHTFSSKFTYTMTVIIATLCWSIVIIMYNHKCTAR